MRFDCALLSKYIFGTRPKALSEVNDHADIMAVNGNERNVVILGKVGAGKRTLGNHIVGEDIFNHKSEALGSRDVDTYYKELEKEQKFYRILIVDTESSHTPRNDPIPHIVEKFKRIHLIIFVIAYGRYTGESHSSLQHVVESLNHKASFISALVITHCESMEASQRDKKIGEFRDNSRSSQVVSFMKNGAYAVGFPDPSALPDNLKSIMQQGIAADKEMVRQMVERCDSSIEVEDLHVQAINVHANVESRSAMHSDDHSPPSHFQQQERQMQKCLSNNDSDENVSRDPDKIPLQPKNKKTVVILGMTRSGKKTLGKCIGGTDLFRNESVTASNKNVGPFSSEAFIEGDTHYRILIIDAEILDIAIQYILENIMNINLIVFVTTHGNYTDESRSWLTQAVKNLDFKVAQISALVITHCENIEPQDRRDIISKFKTDDCHARVAAFMEKGIHAVGFPSLAQSQATPASERLITEDMQTIRLLLIERDCGAMAMVPM